MRSLFFFAALLCSCSILQAQHVVTGRVTVIQTNDPVAYASVTLSSKEPNRQYGSVANAQGVFTLSNVKAGSYEMQVSCLGYKTVTLPVVVSPIIITSYDVFLQPLSVLADEVVVSGIKAGDKSATTFTNLNRQQIREQNFGQDFPYLLNMTPSTVITSDAGNGVGYTAIRIRGVDATRINVTVNGIPMNDAESQNTFWVDFPDLATSAQSVQVQRGVGTSTNGAAAFGASINVQTGGLSEKGYAELSTSAGSFNTLKNTLSIGSGLLPGGWAIDARLSRIVSDGFIDRGNALLKSYFLSAGRYGKRSLLRFNTFSGKEVTYQSWNGVPQEALDTGNRSFNSFTYPNQVDDYQQDHYQLLYSYQLNSKWVLNTALHLTHGKGFYEEFKEQQVLEEYNLVSIIPGSLNDLVRRKWLDNYFYGGTFSLKYDNRKRMSSVIGGAYNIYRGKHFHEVIWVRGASNGSNRHRYVDNDAMKSDFNIYGKLNYGLTKKLNSFIDLQYRHISYTFLGLIKPAESAEQTVKYHFFNPKAGLVYSFSDSADVYLSYGMANREATREEFVSSPPQSRPLPEVLHDVEAGWRKYGKRYSVQLNAYMMYYINQLIVTGQINDVGAYVRKNVPESYRTGLELSGSVNIARWLQWSGNVTYSINRITEFDEYVDDYDFGTQRRYTHANTVIAFSPDLVAGSLFRFIPVKRLKVDIVSKYVSSQFLDNTSNYNRLLDNYFVNDLRILYDLSARGHLKNIHLGLLLNNALNEQYEPNGYTYSGIAEGERFDANFYYPQAGRNFLAQLTLSF
jgi:iron complex outermembrane receptor protein